MTLAKPFIFKVLLTTSVCVALAGCGGQRSPDGYNDVRRQQMGAPTASAPGSVATRLAKLESDVAMLKGDFSQLAMTYNGLMTTNDRIDQLLTRMEQERNAAPVARVEKAKPTKAGAKKTDAALPKDATVLGVRLGEHKDKTRLVIDASKFGDVKTDLDNTEKLLIVTVPTTGWTAKTTAANLSSPLVAGWSVQDDEGAKTLAIQLKKPVKILMTDKIKAEKGEPARYVIDLAAAP